MRDTSPGVLQRIATHVAPTLTVVPEGLPPHGLGLPELPCAQAGRYQRLGVIARREHVEVHRVRDWLLGRIVLMKVVCGASRLRQARLLAEAQITAQLTQRGVPEVHDLGALPDGRAFFTMTALPGTTWGAWLGRSVQMPAPLQRMLARSLVRWLGHATDVIARAHERGVVHADLKPHHLIVAPDAQVHVIDWGLARTWTGTLEPVINIAAPWGGPGGLAGPGAGTPAWRAPEATSGVVAAPADVFALGVMLGDLARVVRSLPALQLAEAATAQEPRHRPTIHQLRARLEEI